MSENKNVGHGHVFPRPDGVRARCGGPGICTVCTTDAAWQHHTEPLEPLVTLAAAQERIEALEAEKAALQRDADRWRTIVPRLLAELGERGRSDGNAPGHAHRVPGVWDSDNGRLAGKTCAWCAVWHEAKTALTLNQKDEQK